MMAGNNKIDRCAAVAIAAALCRLFDNSIATRARLPRKTATGQHVRRHHKEREIKAGIPLCQWNVATYIFAKYLTHVRGSVRTATTGHLQPFAPAISGHP